jgi:hypothetical protein
VLSRARIALGLAVLLSLLISVTVLAKGQFSFIVVTGGPLTDAVHLSDPALTEDFFAFADFYQNKTGAPADPGVGYEITRYYINGHTETAFDRLHYYPESGYVYYDGIVDGSSEYDGKWYTAKPEMQKAFETALTTQLRLQALGTDQGASAMVPPVEALQPKDQVSVPRVEPQSVPPMIVLTGLAVMLLGAFLRFRRFSSR